MRAGVTARQMPLVMGNGLNSIAQQFGKPGRTGHLARGFECRRCCDCPDLVSELPTILKIMAINPSLDAAG